MAHIAYERKNFRGATLDVIRQANEILEEYAAAGYDLTLRQLYYQFVAKGLIANKQAEYNKLGTIVNDARMAGLIDWSHIVDRTRNRRGRFVYHRDGPPDAIYEAGRLYATDLWADQPYYVETWIEKDALVGVLEQACWDQDVPYFSCRGYTSQSEMWSASRRFLKALSQGKKVAVLHLGDHDPSGIDMTRDIDQRLLTFLAADHWRNKMEGSDIDIESSIDYVETNFEVRRLALNMDQVEQYDPPPNPAKLTDSRGAGYVDQYGDESWELDALPPDVLTQLIHDELDELRDHERWQAALEREQHEQALLATCSDRWVDVVEFLSDKY